MFEAGFNLNKVYTVKYVLKSTLNLLMDYLKTKFNQMNLFRFIILYTKLH